jgi:hypothetical protein
MVSAEEIRKKDNEQTRKKRIMDRQVGEEGVRKKDNGKTRKKRVMD